MPPTMINTIKNTINSAYHLNRNGRGWLLDNDVTLCAPHRHCFGFSLDNHKKPPPPPPPPLAFFNAAPPEDIAKMCDAIVAIWHKQTLYLLIIEQKTAHKGYYRKQLANGKLFCDWLIALYKEHGHWSGKPVFIGMLIWQPRNSPRKGATSHRGGQGKAPFTKSPPFDYFIELENETCIALNALLEQIP